MILGYILICGINPLEADTIDGCRLYSRQFRYMSSCEKAYQDFLGNTRLPEGHYPADNDCFSVGTGL
jgi:hypothetical protein